MEFSGVVLGRLGWGGGPTLLPHLPQLLGSVRVSVHLCEHSCSLGALFVASGPQV